MCWKIIVAVQSFESMATPSIPSISGPHFVALMRSPMNYLIQTWFLLTGCISRALAFEIWRFCCSVRLTISVPAWSHRPRCARVIRGGWSSHWPIGLQQWLKAALASREKILQTNWMLYAGAKSCENRFQQFLKMQHKTPVKSSPSATCRSSRVLGCARILNHRAFTVSSNVIDISANCGSKSWSYPSDFGHRKNERLQWARRLVLEMHVFQVQLVCYGRPRRDSPVAFQDICFPGFNLHSPESVVGWTHQDKPLQQLVVGHLCWRKFCSQSKQKLRVRLGAMKRIN